MKKLLSLLGISTIGVSIPATTMYATANNNHITNFSKEQISNSTSYAARALIQGTTGDKYNINSMLGLAEKMNPATNSDPAVATVLKHAFNNFTDVSKMVGSDSTIKYQDGGNSLLPSSIQEMATIINTINDGTVNPTENLLNVAYLADLPKLIGNQLESVLGKDNVLSRILESIPVSVIDKVFNHYTEQFSGTVYASFKPSAMPYAPLVMDANSGFNKAFGDLLSPLLSISQGKDLTDDQKVQLGDFLMFFINYISQFSFASTPVDNDHLYDSKITNEDYLKTTYAKTFSDTINFKNIQSLLNNLLNFDNNGGIGLAQIVNVMFGTSSDGTIAISKENNKTDLANLHIVPELKYYNPVTTELQTLSPIIVKTQLKDKLTPEQLNLLVNDSIPQQLISVIGSLVNNIASNKKVDNSVNIISYIMGVIKYIATQFGATLPDDIDKLVTQIDAVVEDIKMDQGWSSLDNIFNPDPSSRDDLNAIFPVIDEGNGTAWTDIWTGNVPFYSDVNVAMNSIFKLLGMDVNLPTQFLGIKTLLDNMLNQIVSGTTLTYADLLKDLDDKNGIINAVLNNMDKINEFIKDLVVTLTDSTNIDKAKTMVTADLDPTKFDDTMKKIYNDGQYSFLDALTMLTTSTSNTQFAKTGVSEKTISDNIFTLFGFDPTKPDTPIANTMYSVLIKNEALFDLLISGLADSFNNIDTSLEQKPVKDINDWTVANIKQTNENYQYTLTNTDSKLVYTVILEKDSNDDFYKLNVKQN